MIRLQDHAVAFGARQTDEPEDEMSDDDEDWTSSDEDGFVDVGAREPRRARSRMPASLTHLLADEDDACDAGANALIEAAHWPWSPCWHADAQSLLATMPAPTTEAMEPAAPTAELDLVPEAEPPVADQPTADDARAATASPQPSTEALPEPDAARCTRDEPAACVRPLDAPADGIADRCAENDVESDANQASADAAADRVTDEHAACPGQIDAPAERCDTGIAQHARVPAVTAASLRAPAYSPSRATMCAAMPGCGCGDCCDAHFRAPMTEDISEIASEMYSLGRSVVRKYLRIWGIEF